MTKERFFVKVEISQQVRAKFERLYEKRGLSQVEAATRVFGWFMRQDEIVQQAILQQLPRHLEPEAKRMLIEGIIPLTLDADRAAEDAAFDQVIDEMKGGKGKKKGA